MIISSFERSDSPFVSAQFRSRTEEAKRIVRTRIRKDDPDKARKIALMLDQLERELLLGDPTARPAQKKAVPVNRAKAIAKSQAGCGLDLHEAAARYYIPHDELVQMARNEGLPLIAGKLFESDFELWRQIKNGLAPSAHPMVTAKTQQPELSSDWWAEYFWDDPLAPQKRAVAKKGRGRR